MQFNGGEDPATGSAAGCAISYLVRAGAVAAGERIAVRQGVEIGRPSDLYLSAKRGSEVLRAIGEGDRCAGGGQHCSCSKRTAFPAVMHMLSTGIHHCKCG
jgi:predicted PhzF superfamily epimerase YddE/YHI9